MQHDSRPPQDKARRAPAGPGALQKSSCSPGGCSAAGPAGPSPRRPSRVEITLESIGVGGHLKPGAINPVRLSLRSRLENRLGPGGLRGGEPGRGRRAIHGADGLSPGRTNRTWLYPSLPGASAVGCSSVFRVVVFEDDGGRPGAELASAPVSAASAVLPGVPVEMTEDLLLVVGSGTMGLDAYQRGQGRTPVIDLSTRCVVGTVQPKACPIAPGARFGRDDALVRRLATAWGWNRRPRSRAG